MRTSIQKWGNSLAIRLPKPLAEQAQLAQGALVELKVIDDAIRIELVAPTEYTLDALLDAVTPDNLHEAIDTGDPQGQEVW